MDLKTEISESNKTGKERSRIDSEKLSFPVLIDFESNLFSQLISAPSALTKPEQYLASGKTLSLVEGEKINQQVAEVTYLEKCRRLLKRIL